MSRHAPEHTALALAPAPALAALAAVACSSVSHRPDVAALVAGVDRSCLREHVEALDAIGPRPVSDAAATIDSAFLESVPRATAAAALHWAAIE